MNQLLVGTFLLTITTVYLLSVGDITPEENLDSNL